MYEDYSADDIDDLFEDEEYEENLLDIEYENYYHKIADELIED